MRFLAFHLVCAALHLFSPPILAATITWDGQAGNGLWSDPLNWTGDVAPQSGDLVQLTGDTGTIHLDVDFTVAQGITIGTFTTGEVDALVVDPGVTLSIANGGRIDVSRTGSLLNDGLISMVGGAELVAGSGLVTNSAMGSILGGGILRTSNDDGVLTNDGIIDNAYFPGRGVFNNNGVFTGVITTHDVVPSTINNNASATMNITNFLLIQFNLDVFNNYGTLNNAGNTETYGLFRNDGVLNNSPGTFLIRCSGEYRGSGTVTGNPLVAECKRWDGDAGNDLWSDALNWSLDAPPVSSDRIVIDGSTLDTVVRLDVDFTVGNSLEMRGRSSNAVTLLSDFFIEPGVTLTNNGSIEHWWRPLHNDGTLVNNGQFNNLGHLNLGDAIVNNNGTLTNVGTFTNADHSVLNNNGLIDNQGTLVNSCTGTINDLGTFTGNAIFDECIAWDGEAGNGLWSDPQNWTGDTLPVPANDIFLDSNTGTVHLDVDFSVQRRIRIGTLTTGQIDALVIDPGVTLSIANGGRIDVFRTGSLLNDGLISMVGGAELVASSGPVTNSAMGSILGGGILRTSNDDGVLTNDGIIDNAYFPGRGVFNNNGVFTGVITTHDVVPSTINNNAGATMNITNFLEIRYGLDVFNNWGTINNSGSSQNWGTFNNYGILSNSWTFSNLGSFNNHCGGSLEGNPISGNPVAEILCVPELLNPPDGGVVGDDAPVFNWNNPSELRSVTYVWQIASDQDPTVPLQTAATSLTTHTPAAPLADGDYEWKVQAVLSADPLVVSAFSTPRSLTIFCLFDGDGDGSGVCSDCDDADPARFPGNAEMCDGIDNDCDGVVPADEIDADADGFALCSGECDDANPDIHPGASEVNDGLDNQCPGDAGYGLVDEVSGYLGFYNLADPNELSWTAQGGTAYYAVARSDSPDFVSGCETFLTTNAAWNDPQIPVVVGRVYFYLVRALTPNMGSWGRDSAGVERTFICGKEITCDDGLDGDGDGLTDCLDPDCNGVAGCEFGQELTCDDFLDNDGDGSADCDDADCLAAPECQPAVFTFTDTFANDIVDTAVFDFFTSNAADPGDYLFFEIVESSGTYALCSEQATFYRDNYLLLAPTSGVVYSGGWAKWFNLPITGNTWVPDSSSYPSLFGVAAFAPYSWAPEWAGFSGNYFLVVHPAHVSQNCELVDGMFGCGNGTWQLTLRVGPSRLAACGF